MTAEDKMLEFINELFRDIPNIERGHLWAQMMAYNESELNGAYSDEEITSLADQFELIG